MPSDLEHFYPDLGDESLETAICVFHNVFQRIRFSPAASAAFPHAGAQWRDQHYPATEWSRARTPKLSSPLLPDLHSVAPLVNEHGSDSSSLDNMLELLVTGGVDSRKRFAWIPPAWQNIEDIDPDLKAFYQYHDAHGTGRTCWHCTDRRSLRMLLA